MQYIKQGDYYKCHNLEKSFEMLNEDEEVALEQVLVLEVEHSDVNLNDLEDLFFEKYE